MSTEGKTLADFLNDEPSEAPAVEESAPEPVQTEEAETQPRDDHGRFAKKGEEESASPAPVEDPPFEHAAVKGERTRRQAAEQERDSLRAEFEALKQQFQQSQQPKEPPAPPPSLWEDEQAWQRHFGAQVAQQAALNAKLDLSEMLARRDNADFDEMKARFLEMAQQNPAIVQDALADADPWGKAYKIARNAATMAELGATNLDELRAKIREEIMAEQQALTPVSPVQLPPTLTGERSVGTRSGPAWSGPKTLAEYLS